MAANAHTTIASRSWIFSNDRREPLRELREGKKNSINQTRKLRFPEARLRAIQYWIVRLHYVPRDTWPSFGVRAEKTPRFVETKSSHIISANIFIFFRKFYFISIKLYIA